MTGLIKPNRSEVSTQTQELVTGFYIRDQLASLRNDLLRTPSSLPFMNRAGGKSANQKNDRLRWSNEDLGLHSNSSHTIFTREKTSDKSASNRPAPPTAVYFRADPQPAERQKVLCFQHVEHEDAGYAAMTLSSLSVEKTPEGTSCYLGWELAHMFERKL